MTLNRRNALKGIAGVLAASQAPFILAQQRVIIGQSASLTGITSALGKATVAGAQSWLKQYNKNSGSNVELMVLDDGNDVARATANSKQLLERGASALFGYGSATLSMPTLPLVREAGVPFFAPFTGARAIHDKFDPLVFTCRASYAQEASKFVQMISSFGAKKMAVVYIESQIGIDSRDVVVEELKKAGMTASPLISVPRDTIGSDEHAKHLMAEHSDGILFTTVAATTANLISKARGMGLSRSTYIVVLSTAGPSQLANMLGKDNSRGVVVSHVVPTPWSTLDIAREHGTAMRTLDPAETPSFASLEAYMAMRALTGGIDRMRSGKSNLITALENTNLDMGGYRLRYSKDSRSGSRFVDYTVLGMERVGTS